MTLTSLSLVMVAVVVVVVFGVVDVGVDVFSGMLPVQSQTNQMKGQVPYPTPMVVILRHSSTEVPYSMFQNESLLFVSIITFPAFFWSRKDTAWSVVSWLRQAGFEYPAPPNFC